MSRICLCVFTHPLGHCAAGSSGGSSEDSDDEALKDVTYAPADVPELSAVQPKVDQFGLGYTPLSRTPVLGGHVNLFDPAPLSLTEKKKKLLIKGQVWLKGFLIHSFVILIDIFIFM